MCRVYARASKKGARERRWVRAWTTPAAGWWACQACRSCLCPSLACILPRTIPPSGCSRLTCPRTRQTWLGGARWVIIWTRSPGPRTEVRSTQTAAGSRAGARVARACRKVDSKQCFKIRIKRPPGAITPADELSWFDFLFVWRMSVRGVQSSSWSTVYVEN